MRRAVGPHPSPAGSAAPDAASLWEERTFPEIEALLVRGAVAILPVGAIEPHGPHLPLSTDVLIAVEMSRRAARRLAGKGIPALVLPPVTWSVAEWSAGFAGRISLSPATARALVQEIVAGAAAAGARAIGIANAHLEPTHVAGVREASAAVTAAGARVVFPDLTRRALAARLGEAFGLGDHAGRFETSLVLAARPDLVDAAWKTLPAVGPGLIAQIRAGAETFRQAGMDRAYCGDPATATAEEGNRLFDTLATILEEAFDAARGEGLEGRADS